MAEAWRMTGRDPDAGLSMPVLLSAAMLERGVAHAELDGILERTRLYDAAILFKVATRRIDRLNSPRPHDLSAMLGAIAACLADVGWRQ
jgi:hypothetical protein